MSRRDGGACEVAHSARTRADRAAEPKRWKKLTSALGCLEVVRKARHPRDTAGPIDLAAERVVFFAQVTHANRHWPGRQSRSPGHQAHFLSIRGKHFSSGWNA